MLCYLPWFDESAVGVSMEKKKLTEKQRRFVDEYLIDLNATAAAKRAGYSAKTAQEQGARLLSNVKVAAEIQKRKADRLERVEITQDLVVQEVYKLYRICSATYYKIDADGVPEVGPDGKPILKQVDSANARGALDMLMKHTGAYDKDNKQKITGLKIVWEDGSDKNDAGEDTVQAEVSSDGDSQSD